MRFPDTCISIKSHAMGIDIPNDESIISRVQSSTSGTFISLYTNQENNGEEEIGDDILNTEKYLSCMSNMGHKKGNISAEISEDIEGNDMHRYSTWWVCLTIVRNWWRIQ